MPTKRQVDRHSPPAPKDECACFWAFVCVCVCVSACVCVCARMCAPIFIECRACLRECLCMNGALATVAFSGIFTGARVVN